MATDRDDELETRVHHLALARKRSSQSILREAVRQYLDREDAREGFKQEASSSWAAYQDNGRHLSSGEIRDWLSGWGTDDEASLPECHG